MSPGALTTADYRTLLAFRTALTRFLHWSAEQLGSAGLTPQQHNLLLAIRGHPGASGPSIREIAEYLALRHHTAVELVDRVQQAGLVKRCSDPRDRRIVRVQLTGAGKRLVARLDAAHREELRQIAPALGIIYQSLGVPAPDSDQERPEKSG